MRETSCGFKSHRPHHIKFNKCINFRLKDFSLSLFLLLFLGFGNTWYFKIVLNDTLVWFLGVECIIRACDMATKIY